MKELLLVYLLIFVVSCAGVKPIKEFTIARAAMNAARENGASSLAPGFWHKAEQHYLKGRRLFKENINRELGPILSKQDNMLKKQKTRHDLKSLNLERVFHEKFFF